jgi:hypothetical protein
MTDSVDTTILAALATALLDAASQQNSDHRVDPGQLPRDYFEQAAHCTTAQVAAGFKQLDLRFLNNGGDILFDRKKLEKAIKNAND